MLSRGSVRDSMVLGDLLRIGSREGQDMHPSQTFVAPCTEYLIQDIIVVVGR